MTLNSIEFLGFLLIVSILYFIIPKKGRRILLLITSLAFYLLWNIPNTAVLFVTAVLTYCLGLGIDRANRRAHERGHGKASELKRKEKLLLVLGLILLIGTLFFYKYLNFVTLEINALLAAIGSGLRLPSIKGSLIVPLGISFYVFQSIGYLADVYQGKVKAERNVVSFLLFISFFPKIIQGPIERSDGFLKQIRMIEKKGCFDSRRIGNALVTILWGMFLKMVIADRIAIIVDNVFSTYYIYGTVELAFAAICYAIQIYCDFAGYSAMAVGTARIFGFELTQNFDCPYFSASTREFWRRWHISLSSWFKDYVYIPLGGSRCSKLRKWLNVMIVMLVSGIWHGAGWTFIVWGMLHGVYQVAGDALSPLKSGLQKRLNVRVHTASHRLGCIIVTFILIDLAWIFFRAPSIGIALDYLRIMLSRFNPWALFDGSLLKLGLAQIEMNVLQLGLMILFAIDYIQYKKGIRIDEMLEGQCLWFRWTVIITLFTLTWICGEYGPSFSSSNFIYQSF